MSEPKLMESRFKSRCAKSGEKINAGDKIAYFKEIKRAVHEKYAEDFDPSTYKK